MTIDKLFIRRAAESASEDGGPGSGNWGHRGRPGLRGGSGKGGGSHYRGGREDMGEYFSTRHDWLNGLKGERQRQVTNWLKMVASGRNTDIEGAQKKLMQEDWREGKAKLLEAMAESRKWDDNSEKYFDNLTEEEANKLDRYINQLQGERMHEMLPEATQVFKSDTAFNEFADLLSKAMGGPTSGTDYSSKGIEYDLEQMTNGNERDRILALLHSAAAHYSSNDIGTILNSMQYHAFRDPASTDSVAALLRTLGHNKNYGEKLFSSDDPLSKENVELLKKYTHNVELSEMNLWLSENNLLSSNNDADIQKYLANKWTLLGGKPPLQIKARALKDKAEEKAKLRAQGKTVFDENSHIARSIGKTAHEEMSAIIAKCQHKETLMLWDAASADVTVGSATSNNAYYDPKDGRIYFDRMEAIDGDKCHVPYQILAHESGHSIDYAMGKKYGTPGKGYSTLYNNGEFVKTLHDEVDAWVEKERKAAKAEAEKHMDATKENLDWLINNNYVQWGDAWRYARQIDAGYEKFDKMLAANLDGAIQKKFTEKVNQDKYRWGDVSDIIQGCTKNRIRGPVGHKQNYYAGHNSRENVANEAFTEIFAGYTTNPVAVEAIREYFPKTVEVYDRMVKELFAD